MSHAELMIDTAEHAAPWDDCRRGRALVCGACLNPRSECRCSDVLDDLTDELTAAAGEKHVADLEPATQTLLGLPTGIHCHAADGCASGHCEVSA